MIELDVVSTETDEETTAPEAEVDAATGTPLALSSGPASPDDVRRIIDQQPIEVAALLRSWADEAVSN